MRTMFVWRSAMRLPTVIVSAASTHISGLDHVGAAGEGHQDQLQQRHEAGRLRGHGEERGDRRGRALVGVGRPRVERHGRHLEGEADHHEDDAERDQRTGVARTDRGTDVGEQRAAGRTRTAATCRRASRPRRTRPSGSTSRPPRCRAGRACASPPAGRRGSTGARGPRRSRRGRATTPSPSCPAPTPAAGSSTPPPRSRPRPRSSWTAAPRRSPPAGTGAFRTSEKLSTAYAPPNIARSAPSTASVSTGTNEASSPMPAICGTMPRAPFGRDRSTSSTSTIAPVSTISGASAWKSTSGRTKSLPWANGRALSTVR